MKSLKLLMVILVFLIACQKKALKQPPAPGVPRIATVPRKAVITRKVENVRFSPNGQILGQVFKGDTIYIEKRIVNWLLFHNSDFDSSFVWAPAAGFDYINLFNPLTYYDTTAQKFYPLTYFQRLFGNKGKEDSLSATEREIFFSSNLGLGSHEDIILDLTKEKKENIKHGIALYQSIPSGIITRIRIDFFQPAEGIRQALKKCGLPDRPFSSENPSQVVWKPHAQIKGLEIQLERLEWKSALFSAVQFIKEG
jgi:hypothetical protein